MSQRISAGELSGEQFHDPYSYPNPNPNPGPNPCTYPRVTSYGFVPAEVSSLW